MRKRALSIASVVAVAGIAGFFLRRRFVETGFDGETGFPVPGIACGWLLAGLTVVTAVFLFSATIGKKLKEDPRGSAAGASFVSFLCVFLSSILIVIGALLLPRHTLARFQNFSKIETALVVTGIIAAVCQTAAAVGRLAGKRSTVLRSLDLVPSLFAAFALLICYLLYASDPVILRFAWEILALAAASYGLYAAAAPESAVCRWGLVRWAGLAVFLLMTALGGRHSLGVILGLGGLLLRLAAEFVSAFFCQAGQHEKEN